MSTPVELQNNDTSKTDADDSNDNDSDSEEDPTRARTFKVILLGDGTVGKTSISNRLSNESFQSSYKQTIGVDFFVKQFTYPNDQSVILQIWDIGGQNLGSKMLKSYISGASAIVFAYDITSMASFQNIEDWLQMARRVYMTTSSMPYCALVGNKSDLKHLRMVPIDMHNQFADENGMQSFIMSAKNGDQVNSCFFRLGANLAHVSIDKGDVEVNTRVVEARVIDYKNVESMDDDGSNSKQGHKQRHEIVCNVC